MEEKFRFIEVFCIRGMILEIFFEFYSLSLYLEIEMFIIYMILFFVYIYI